jgi:hypothetical protein
MGSKPQVIKDWELCVKLAKKKLGVPEDKFVMIKGSLLKEAQKCFCAMGY